MEKTPINGVELEALRVTCKTFSRIVEEADAMSVYLPGLKGTLNDLFRTYGEAKVDIDPSS